MINFPTMPRADEAHLYFVATIDKETNRTEYFICAALHDLQAREWCEDRTRTVTLCEPLTPAHIITYCHFIAFVQG